MAQLSSQLSSLLLEIGTEDIPARFIPVAIQQLKENSELIFKENRIGFSVIRTYGSPRRLTLIAEGIPMMQEDRVKEIFGPPKKIAFDEAGRPTKAAVGFARSQGVNVENLVIKEKDGKEYAVAVIEEKGVIVSELMPEVLKRIVLSLHFPKSMRWGSNTMRFVRPIRWLLSLFDDKTVIFEIDGIKSSNVTRGHRFLSPAAFQIKGILSYSKLLFNNYVIVDQEERKRIIAGKIEELCASVNGMPVRDDALLETVSNLVEYPVPVLGSFSEEYLKLPKELLITVMKEHQKYFAVENETGALTNYFVVVSNTTEENSETVRTGAERVIKARFEDARFYFEDDTKRSLQSRIDDLRGVVFQERLGNLYDKVLRVKKLALYLSSKMNPSLTQKAERAALLSKTDLLTGVVREFPELQGIMGKYYALNDGEDSEVANALMEQYLPAYHGDLLPETEAGVILSLADKIDNIVSFFSIGLVPSGSEDPFALRRQALAVMAIMLDKGCSISLREVVAEACRNLDATVRTTEVLETVLRFFEQRFEPLFSIRGYSFDEIQSVISFFTDIPLQDVKSRLDALQEFKKDKGYNDFLTAIKRVKNIIPAAEIPSLDIKLLLEEPEKGLYEKLNKIKADVGLLLKEKRYIDALRRLSSLTDSINQFFDNVLVMDRREEIKLNRLALLRDIWSMATSIVDFSKL